MSTDLSFADAIHRWSLHDWRGKNWPGSHPATKVVQKNMELVRNSLRTCNKFVADESFVNLCKKNIETFPVKKIISAVELARLPYETMLLSFSTKGGEQGFLYRQWDRMPDNWSAFTFLRSNGDITLMPLAVNVGDEVFKASSIVGKEGAPIALGGIENKRANRLSAIMWGLDGTRSALAETFCRKAFGGVEPIITGPLLLERDGISSQGDHGLIEVITEAARMMSAVIPLAIMMLAMINYVPCKITHKQRKGFYPYRLKNHQYLSDSTITIDVSRREAARFLDSAFKGAHSRHRAHDVRGFWRFHRSAQPCKDQFEHDWIEDAPGFTCKKCETYRVWINEHVRGDATLGFVKHRYEVTA